MAESQQTTIKSQTYKSSKQPLKQGQQTEIAFVMDATGSMAPHRNMVVQWIQNISQSLAEFYVNKYTSIGMAIYRDHFDAKKKWGQFGLVQKLKSFQEKAMEFNEESIKLQTKSLENFATAIQKVECPGGSGGDAAEDIKGGLQFAIKELGFEGRHKFIILIADAYCHGLQWNGLTAQEAKEGLDDYPNDDLAPVLDLLIEQEIRLFIANVSKETFHMSNKIIQYYKEKADEERKKIALGQGSNSKNSTLRGDLIENLVMEGDLTDLQDINNIRIYAEKFDKFISESIKGNIQQREQTIGKMNGMK